MKQVAHYIGRLTKLSTPPEVSYAFLKEMPNGTAVSTTAETELFTKNGINEGDEFEIRIFQESDGTISSSMSKITIIDDPNFDI
jgi:hypothetical protein